MRLELNKATEKRCREKWHHGSIWFIAIIQFVQSVAASCFAFSTLIKDARAVIPVGWFTAACTVASTSSKRFIFLSECRKEMSLISTSPTKLCLPGGVGDLRCCRCNILDPFETCPDLLYSPPAHHPRPPDFLPSHPTVPKKILQRKEALIGLFLQLARPDLFWNIEGFEDVDSKSGVGNQAWKK